MNDRRNLKGELKSHKKLIQAAVVILAIAAAVLFYAAKEKSDTIDLSSAEKQSSSEEKTAAETQSEVYIDIDGAVKEPGVYKVKSGSRIFEVIEKAGGLTAKADTLTINQADRVKDGQKITIPRKGEAGDTASSQDPGSAAEGTGTSSASSGGLININTADSNELQQITGVGPATAEKIIQYRSENGAFRSKEDLKNVSGIGEKTYQKMEPMITI